MEDGDTLALGFSTAAVLVSALLVLAEAVLARASRIRALAWAEEGRRGAARLARLLEAPDRPLAAVAVVRMGIRTAVTTVVGIVGWREAGAAGAAGAVAALVLVILVFGELAPRRLAARFSDRLAPWVAGPVAALARLPHLAALGSAVTTPLVVSRGRANGVPPGTEAEEPGSAEEEEIDAEEQELIHSIFEFGDTIVREVMVPRTDMVTVPVDAAVEDALDVAIGRGFSRLPVLRNGSEEVVGLVYVKDLIRAVRQGQGGDPVSRIMRKAVFVPEQKRVAELLREMQTRKFHLAIAIDEYGGVAGLVTLEDLLEEIVGEIVDEYDVEEPHVEELGNGLLRVNGRTPIDEINERLGLELPATEWDTVGGLIFNLVGHVPEQGEKVTFQGIEFEAERVQGRRIVSVRIRAEPSRAAG